MPQTRSDTVKLAYDQEVACDRIRDDACVRMLLLTSSPIGRMLYNYEKRMGVPAYDAPPLSLAGQERKLVVMQQCAASGCTARFVVQNGKSHRLYCSKRCKNKTAYELMRFVRARAGKLRRTQEAQSA